MRLTKSKTSKLTKDDIFANNKFVKKSAKWESSLSINLYAKFLNLTNEQSFLSQFPALSPQEQYVLLSLNDFWVNGNKITVLDAADSMYVFSRASVIRFFKALRKKGYITMTVDDEDNRVKFIEPTNLLLSYFKKHEDLMIKILSN